MGQIICNGTEVKTLIYNGVTIAEEGYTVEQYNTYGTERYNAGYSKGQLNPSRIVEIGCQGYYVSSGQLFNYSVFKFNLFKGETITFTFNRNNGSAYFGTDIGNYIITKSSADTTNEIIKYTNTLDTTLFIMVTECTNGYSTFTYYIE